VSPWFDPTIPHYDISKIKKKRIDIKSAYLEIVEDGTASILFECIDGRVVTFMVPPVDFLNQDIPNPLSVAQIVNKKLA
jgi:Iap family predicted aminopeptidase